MTPLVSPQLSMELTLTLTLVQKGENRNCSGILRQKHVEVFKVLWRMASELNMILRNWRHDLE